MWNNWTDSEGEYGLRIGLRTFRSASPPQEKKEVWHVYKAAETSAEDVVFYKYLNVIGIDDWDIIQIIK
jgi:hypothetical protein